jgi:hypothetical protein
MFTEEMRDSKSETSSKKSPRSVAHKRGLREAKDFDMTNV